VRHKVTGAVIEGQVDFWRAETILDQLDQVRLALLTGSMSRQSLQQLSHLVRVQREQFNNPRLAEVLDEIELRAEVELAKYAAAS
jgi:DNA polymerase III delta prime subunit